MAQAGASLDNPITLDSDSDGEGQPCTITASTRPQQQEYQFHETPSNNSEKPFPKRSTPALVIRNPYLKKTRTTGSSFTTSSPPEASSLAKKSLDATASHSPPSGFDNQHQHDQQLHLPTSPPPQTAKPPALISLSPKQQACLDAAKNGDNVFLTGPAGTGKTAVLDRIIADLQERYKDNEWVVTAPTGTCAVALGGQTIHSFAGCGKPVTVEDFDKAFQPERREKWKKLKVLLVDEISMCSGEFLDCLSNVVSKIRKRIDLPFGGIQLIFCGDFLQLPPIPMKEREIEDMVSKGRVRRDELFQDRGFAFQAEMFHKAEFSFFILDQVFRQSNREFSK